MKILKINFRNPLYSLVLSGGTPLLYGPSAPPTFHPHPPTSTCPMPPTANPMEEEGGQSSFRSSFRASKASNRILRSACSRRQTELLEFTEREHHHVAPGF